MQRPFWSWDLRFILGGNGNKSNVSKSRQRQNAKRRLRSEQLSPRLLLAADIDANSPEGDVLPNESDDRLAQETSILEGPLESPQVDPTFDVNLDGNTTTLDLLLVVNAVNTGVDSNDFAEADVNRDDAIDAADIDLAIASLQAMSSLTSPLSQDSCDDPDLLHSAPEFWQENCEDDGCSAEPC